MNNLKLEIQSFLKKAKKPLIVVLGPTASGKTSLSLKIAHFVDGEIISTDSRQIYKEMDIGTDSISLEEQDGVPHHLLGIRKPDQTLTLAEYQDLATQKIKEISDRKHIPMLVGGTGLYISSIIENYTMPRIAPDPDLRNKLEKEAQEKGPEFLHKKLQKLDPESAANIHANNIRYVIRAIEIAKSPKASVPVKTKSPYDIFLVGIHWPREILYQNIEKRVERQISRGLVDEVKELLEKGYDEALPSMSSLGVKEIIPYIKGQSSLEECIAILKRNTRRYAKRQMTWFRRYDKVRWLSPKEYEEVQF